MFSRVCGLLGCNQIFGSYDLPLPVALYPCVCPNKAATARFSTAPLPRLASLSYGSVAVEPHLDVIGMVAHKVLRRLARIRNHLCLVVERPLGIHTDKVVSQDACNRRAVARGV